MLHSDRGVSALWKLFEDYGEASGQMVCKGKCSIFFGKHICANREQAIMDLMEIRESHLPFTYLGAPIFKGSPKASYFRKICDKVCNQYAGWKGKMLSIAGRTQLVKSVIHDMLVYTLLIYRWPNNLLHRMDMAAKNFIYTRDIHSSVLTTVAMWNICNPTKEGSLRIRSLREFDQAGMLKLA